ELANEIHCGEAVCNCERSKPAAAKSGFQSTGLAEVGVSSTSGGSDWKYNSFPLVSSIRLIIPERIGDGSPNVTMPGVSRPLTSLGTMYRGLCRKVKRRIGGPSLRILLHCGCGLSFSSSQR